MTQKLTSELVLRLSQNVSGPAAEARKALAGVDQALAAIGKRKDAERVANALNASYAKQKERLRDLTNQVIAAEKPAKALMSAHQAAEKALEQTARKIQQQQSALQSADQAMRQFVGSAETMAQAEARIRSQAEQTATALAETAKREEKAAQQRRSFLKEVERSANEIAAQNRRAAGAALRAEAEKTRAVAREARKREELLRKEAAEEIKITERHHRAMLKEIERNANAVATANKKAKERAERDARTQRDQRNAAVDTLTSIGGMLVGQKLSDAAASTVEGAARREQALNRIRNVSGSEDEVAAADDISARASAAFPLTSQEQSLEDYAELRSLAASSEPGKPIDLHKMSSNVMLMAQARAALASSGFTLDDGEAKALAQAIEGSGRAMDPESQWKMMDAYVRGKQVFGNALNASMIRDFVMNAKGANFSAADPSFFYTTFARLAQGNASRLGNEFAQTMNTLVGGHMTKQSAEWLADHGLIDPSQIKKGGGGKFYIEGGVKDADLLSTDQTAWAQQRLLPALLKDGTLSDQNVKKRVDLLRKSDPTADPKTLEEQAMHGLISDEISRAGFRSTVSDNLIHAIANELLTFKDVEQLKTATGLGAVDNISRNPIATFEEMTTAIANFGSTLSAPAMKDAAAIMHSIASGISELTISLREWQKNNPKTAEAVGAAAPAAMYGAGGYLALLMGSKLVRGLLGGLGGATAGSATASSTAAAALAGGATTGGLLRYLLRLGTGPFGFGAATASGLSVADPNGNLWGLTDPIDKWSEQHLGFNPSNVHPFGGNNQGAPSDVEDTRSGDVQGRAGSPIPDPFAGMVNPYDDPLKKTFAPTVDLQKQSAVVEDQARQLLASIQAIFAGGVTMPVRIDSNGVQAAIQSAKRSAEGKIEDTLRSTYADLELG